jgi:hypothetical protein
MSAPKVYRRFTDGNGQTIISGDFTPKRIRSLIRFYASYGLYLDEVGVR